MTKIPKFTEQSNLNSDELEKNQIPIRKQSNYKHQKPLLEKRRRDRINQSLDELKNLLLTIKQRNIRLDHARLEKADILEMVVKHLKDVKKRRQALLEVMEPYLFRSFKIGYWDCAKLSINFIDSTIESTEEKKQQIINYISKECMKTIDSSSPPQSFNQYHEIAFANCGLSENFKPFPFLLSSLENESFDLPLIHEQLESFHSGKYCSFLSNYRLSAEKPTPNAFNIIETPSTSGTSVAKSQQGSISVLKENETSDEDDDDEKLIIDDLNNNQAAWRPWL